MNYKLNVNGQEWVADADPDTPLLWVIREHLGMTGSKYGCGMGLCGACTMEIDGKAQRTCTLPVSSVGSKAIRTIEALAASSDGVEQAVIQAWQQEQVAQCGYCQSGQIVQAAHLLKTNPNPSDEEINHGMAGNICRCGAYPAIRKAIRAASMTISQHQGGTSHE